ncbi:unnamed protein product [Lota lota]
MARAETLESAGAGGGGGGGGRGGAEGERGGPLVRASSCRMELPRPGFEPWSGLLTTTTTSTSTSTIYSLHQSQNHPLHTLPLPHPRAMLHHGGPPQPPPPLAPCTRRKEEEERPWAEDRVCSGEPPAERTGSGREERQESSREQGPLPDMQPQDEQPCWGLARRGFPGEAVEEEGIRRVAHRLIAIGDQINTTVLHRAAAPQWRDFRSACLQLLNFVSQTFNTLYRLI